ncbi:MAG TPA: hypothetical protein VN213_20985, partial [Solirubrobacteraceae bacterium]|nr:hypothetical protein [Solirubrobacteraceae bacterium]
MTPLPHRTLIRAIAAAVSAVAAITLVGWAAAIPEIVEPQSVTPMAPTTALAVLALASGLWALSAERRRTGVASVAGGVAAIVGVACAAEAIAGSGTGVSEALFGVAAFTPAVTGLVVAVLGLAVALDRAERR